MKSLANKIKSLIPPILTSILLVYGNQAPAEQASFANDPYAEQELTDSFLDENTPRAMLAIQKAWNWLDRLEVNPIELRQFGVKGKKKLAEQLDAYLWLHDIASAAARPRLMQRIRTITAITANPDYHDMLAVDDLVFKQDATSYLRVARLMDELKLDTTLYRREIQKCVARLNAHMPTRGVNQRMAFDEYYRHFNLPEPFPLAGAFETGLIKARTDPLTMIGNHKAYDLTHEIFVPYEFGRKRDADFFSPEDKHYLRATLAVLTEAGMHRDDPDITAELNSCMSYLQQTDTPIYRSSLEYLLNTQRPQGAWGNYEHMRPYYGRYVEHGFYLHTTLVVMDALISAFCFR